MKYLHASLFAVAVTFTSIGLPQSAVLAQNKASHSHEEHKEAPQATEKTIADSIAKLTPEEQKLVKAQRFCPVMEYTRLGAMGAPIKVVIDGKPVFVCCKGCVKDATAGGAKTLKTTASLIKVSAELAKLSPEERHLVEAQKYCAINTSNFLGSMGAPIKLQLDGKPVYLCCDGCTEKAKSDPKATLAKVEELKSGGDAHDHEHDHAHEHNHSK